MPITPTSPEAIAAIEVRNLIASAATFIAATGSANFTEAKNRVYIVERLPETPGSSTEYVRPFALVLMPVFSFLTSRCGIPEGAISAMLEFEALPTDSPEDSLIKAANFFGGVKSEVSQLGSPVAAVVNDAALRFSRVSQQGPYVRVRDTGKHDYWIVRWIIQLN